jgi:two-component system sensor histidine kinase KdpD
LGVFGIALGTREEELTPSQHQVLETFVAQAGLAIERVSLRDDVSRANVTAETERTRSTLLSTVSHDLRTPLASITGSAQVLLDDESKLTPEARRNLIETIREEGDRLSRLVANLLDLTRVESGSFRVRLEWCPVDEVVHSAIGRVGGRCSGRTVGAETPEVVLLAHVDPVLIEQVLVNLIENACKYSALGTPIEVRARREEREIVFEVADRGRGIPSGEERRIFEKFYRIADGGSEGAGLGLALADAIVRAHGGTIRAEHRDGGGSLFRVALPAEQSQPPVSEAALVTP